MAYATPDGKGDFLRKHAPEKMEQHRATMEQIGTPRPEEWKEWLRWFSMLPMFLDLGNLRAVHASWDPVAVAVLASVKRIDAPILHAMAPRGSRLNEFKETLLNGVELTLPEGHLFFDKSGHGRKHIRTRWWESLKGKTYRQAVFPGTDDVPETTIPADLMKMDLTYGVNEPPVFFGHYWLPADALKRQLAPNVACLDFSVAKGGDLTAYQWDGESTLDVSKFVGVR